MKVAYLCLQTPRQGQASHAHVHEMISGLRSLGTSVELFTPPVPSASAGGLRRIVTFFLVQWRLMRSLRRFDVLYLRAHSGAFPTTFLARVTGIPVVQEVNGTPEEMVAVHPGLRPFGPIITFLDLEQLRRSTRVLAVSEPLAAWLESNGVKSVRVVPNAANTDLFRPDGPTRELPFPYVLFFGALSPWQGLETLLDALDHSSWPSSVRAVVAGDGVERVRVEAEAATREGLLYLGTVPYEDMPSLIRGSIATVSPKSRAGWHMSPLKVYESLACGVPVIVTDIASQAEVVRDSGAGIVVEVDAPDELAAAVSRLRGSAELRRDLGRRGARYVAGRHTWHHRAEQVRIILHEVLG